MLNWITRRIENIEIVRLRNNVKFYETKLAKCTEVTIPLLERKVELLERVNDIYASRIESEVKRVEAETQRLARNIAENALP